MPGAGVKPCLYFGTFNPIHNGHLMIAQAVLNQQSLGVDRIFFIPAGSPPHRNHESDLASPAHRLQMVQLATASNPAFRVLEDEIKRPGNSYTIDTVESFLSQGLITAPVPMIIGSDALAGLGVWHRADDLAKLIRFLQMPRPGSPFIQEVELTSGFTKLNTQPIEMPLTSLSSSWIRAFIRRNHGASASLRYFVPEPVRNYIQENHLYVTTL